MRALSLARENSLPILARGGGTALAGQTCNAALVLDFSKYMNRFAESTPNAASRWSSPAWCRPAQRGARAARPVLRARSVDQRSMHDRRDDRQQLLRRAFGRVRQDRRQRRGAGSRPLRRHPARARRERRGRNLRRRDARRARRRALCRDTRARERSADEIRRRYPKLPRRVSGYNLDELLPERGLQSGARDGRLGGDAWRHDRARRSGWCRVRAGSRWWCSASTTSISPPIRCRGF